MENLMPVLKQVAVEGLLAQTSRRNFRSGLAGIGWYVLAGCGMVLALVFGGIAVYGWLTLYMAPHSAAAVIAILFLLLAGGFFVLGQRLFKRGVYEDELRSRTHAEQMVAMISDDLCRELAEPVRDNPKSALLAAAVAGFLTGDRMR